MAIIKVLPDDLVNKIAAGEVVEKPASVIKELLDNAYDANASHITVEVAEGGKKKMLVIDDGVGMDKEDLELAFKPHATSKISNEDDLLKIASYGFRGEALSSIASVSKITVKTRKNNEQLGHEIVIEGGNVVSISEVGTAVGTSILIEDLFYNVPARKEFLKSDQAEYKSILQTVSAHAIANPSIGVSLKNNDKVVYTLAKDHQLEDRVGEILGNDTYKKLVPIFYEHPHIEIYGFVGKPEVATDRAKNQYIFVNKRKVSDKSIAFAVKDAYGSLIPKNMQPQYIVFIDVPANIVDVNVHPRKEEVKFSDNQLIFTSVKTSVKKALDRVDLTPGNESGMPGNANSADPLSPFGAPPTRASNSNPFGSSLGKNQKSPKSNAFPPYKDPFGKAPFNDPLKPIDKKGINSKDNKKKNPFGSNSLFDKPIPAPSSNFADPYWDDPLGSKNTDNQQLSDTKILQIHNLYLVTEGETGIIIYDQHAVHERILYEKLINEHKEEKDEGSAQKVLAPIIINLSVEEAETMKEFQEEFEKLGFELEDFGGNSYKVTQIPTILIDIDIKSIIHEMLEDLENDGEIKKTDSANEKILTYLSCRTAYKAGDIITEQEAAAMIDQLSETETSYTCPHGRPVKIEISYKELSKMFKRTK